MPFKGKASAPALARRWGAFLGGRGAAVRLLPFADGGEGTAEVLRGALGGRFRRARLTGPAGKPVSARWLWVPERRLAVVDAAAVCGWALVARRRRDPIRARSRGLGEWILRAVRAGAREAWIGLGGTATVDGGVGALSALGVRFYDRAGGRVAEGVVPARIAWVDRARLDPRVRRLRIRLLCDVHSPLLGPRGAARLFGPQKGATPRQAATLERGMAALARAIHRACGRDVRRLPGAGAAGGIGAGLAGVLGARLVAGAPFVARAVGLAEACRRADLVVTGEGRLDAQTLQGKGAFQVARLARRAGIPAVALVGKNRLSARAARRMGLAGVFEGSSGLRRLADWIAARFPS